MGKEVLGKDNIHLKLDFKNKEEAIRYIGYLLVKNGYVQVDYVDKMLEREHISSTYLGNYVAIPHGTEEAKKEIIETGITVVTVPDGVDFGNGNIVKILVGIAGKGEEHLEILSKIAIVLAEEKNIDQILAVSTKEEILHLFQEVN